ncbi:MAG TPA: ABC transporter ATP-binding protein [Thermoanaerobaculia bacterium]|nr:ABC transporter ATP-binding protein [Thermoanaerobaculia bacterium]
MTLRVEGMSVRRGGRALLDDVSFTARPNEILGIIGPNGAGKTTLFEAIAGFIPRTGSVMHTSPLFYLPDGIRPWPEQRAGWCLDFFARLFGRERDADAITILELEPFLAQRNASLSKGEAKRVALALALGTPQPILLLDEPFDGLDFRQTRSAMQLLRSRAAAGRTLVVSIHQLADAARVCDRFLLLDHGRAIAEGDLAELRARAGNADATLEEVFLAVE